MAYDTKELMKRAKKLIKEKKYFFISDVFQGLGIVSSTFYEHFPSDSSDYKELQQLLIDNRIEVKTGLRAKWYKSNHPTLQLGLYKLIGSDEEREKLSVNYTKTEHSGSIKHFVEPDLSNLSDSTLEELEELYLKAKEQGGDD